MARIRSFKELKVWQLARQIRHKIYIQNTVFGELNEDLATFVALLNGYIRSIGRNCPAHAE